MFCTKILKAFVSLKKIVLLRLNKTKFNARMAELVDALVSKTSEVTLVPVRSRLRVQRKLKGFLFYLKSYVYGICNKEY